MTKHLVTVYGGTWEIADWIAAGKPLPVGSVEKWARLSPKMVEQWRADPNGGLDITQVPADLSTVAFYWECEVGHLWRETPYLRRDVGRKSPRWKVVALTRAACRACTLEHHGARYECGCPDPDLANVGRSWSSPFAVRGLRRTGASPMGMRSADVDEGQRPADP